MSGIRTHDPGFGASEDSACLRPLGYCDRLCPYLHINILFNGAISSSEYTAPVVISLVDDKLKRMFEETVMD
jgi:hypothetical protein